MTNADNYTDTTDTDFKGASYNIDTGKSLSAEGVRNALHTKEKVANKQMDSTDAAGTLTSSSSDSYYPTSKLVGKNLGTLRSDKQDKIPAGTAKNIVAYSGTAGTFGELTRAATAMETSTASASDDKIPTEKAVATALAALGLSGKENTSNKATSIEAANQNDETKYPTIGAVTAWATSTLMDILLPAGTIIAMRSTYYYSSASATFRDKWKVCDGQGTTPNLRNLFLRGMAEGGAEAGSDSVTLAAANLPGHTHTFSGSNVTGNIYGIARGWQTVITGDGVFAETAWTKNVASQRNDEAENGGATIKFSMTPAGNVTGGGGDPQTPVAIVPKYYAVIYVMKVS
ncbi:MAG: hypothetical protein LBK68_06930 [Candidatus Margulisbacteria bacterium]|nr:hypothetical protein [Candidatus Margulisiibacteriota bacterium]